jgi:hypothetical protein
MLRDVLTGLVIGALLLASIVCEARTTRQTTYRYQQLWSSAVRFLRVDNGFAIKEQDKETGYLLFEYPDAGRSLVGSMELIPTVTNNKKYINVNIRIQDMPTYVEVVLADKLVRKLRAEYGDPPMPELAVKKAETADKKEASGEDGEKKASDETMSSGQPKEKAEKE